MFCPKCGSKAVLDIFCADCLKEEKPLLASFKDVHFVVCAVSGDIRHRGRWVAGQTKKQMDNAVREHLVFQPYADVHHVDVAEVPFELKPGLKTRGEVLVKITGKASARGQVYVEEYQIPYILETTVSPKYARLGTSYFEAILQVRNEDAETRRKLKEILSKQEASIAKELKVGNGTDYYLMKKRSAARTAHALIDAFGGLLKESRTLFSRDRQRSKDIYRTTIFVELPPFRAGAVVKAKRSVYLVVELGKRLRLYDLRKGKVTSLEYRDASWEQLSLHETTVAAIAPVVLVLHPETFEAMRLSNITLPRLERGQRVEVVLDGLRAYLVLPRDDA